MNTEVWRSVSSADDCRGKPRVDALVRRPILAAKSRPDVDGMRERPHTLVREAVVVTTFFLGREPDPSQRVRRLVRRNDDPVVRVDHVRVGVTPAVCDPGPAPLAHQRIEGHRHASSRRRDGNRTILTPHVLVRFAIGHHNEWTSVSTVQGYLRHRLERSKVAARKRIAEPDRSSRTRTVNSSQPHQEPRCVLLPN